MFQRERSVAIAPSKTKETPLNATTFVAANSSGQKRGKSARVAAAAVARAIENRSRCSSFRLIHKFWRRCRTVSLARRALVDARAR